MHTRTIRTVSNLFAVCAALLAMPGTAMAANTLSGPLSVSEAAGTATYTLTCGSEPLDADTISIAVTGGPAPAAAEPADFEAPTVTPIVCNPLAPIAHTIEVPVVDDSDDEQDEKYTVAATGVTTNETVESTIVDDDPIASIAPVAFVEEGDSGTKNAELEVKLSSAPVQTTTIKYATEDLTAIAGSDYVQTAGDLVFQPGETTKKISVPIIGDTAFEEEAEGFFVNLTSTNNGALSQKAKQGGVAIFDNDPRPLPAITIDRAVTVDEGNRGTTNALFTVSLSSAPVARVEVTWKTLDWNATEPDYEAAGGTLVFQPGQRSKTISVNVKGDRSDEPDEAFAVMLENAVGATLPAGRLAFGIITDDDGPRIGIRKQKQRSKALVTRLTCPATASRCRGVLRGKAGKRRLGRKVSFDMLKGTSTKVRMRLSRRVRNRLEKRGLRAKLIAVTADADGDKRKTKRRVRLKRVR